jgi:hypothetical protein
MDTGAFSAEVKFPVQAITELYLHTPLKFLLGVHSNNYIFTLQQTQELQEEREILAVNGKVA